MLCILGYVFSRLLQYYLPSAACNALMAMSGLGFLVIIIGHIGRYPLKGLTGFIFACLMLWTLILVVRLFIFDLDDIRATFTDYKGWTSWVSTIFGSPYLMPHLLPFFLLGLPKSYHFDFKYLWHLMWLLCILYLCYYPFAFWNMIHFSWSMEIGAGESWGDKGTYGDFINHSTLGIATLAPVVIMIYFKKYLSAKQWNWFLVSYIGSLIITVFLARRGQLSISLLYLVLAWFMYSLFDKRTSFLKMLLMGFVVVGLVYLLFSGTSDTLFATLLDRGMEDTRSGVEESFYADMKTTNDWLLGRGWFGQYYDYNFASLRPDIETGYLALILRGGLLYLIPYVLVLGLTFFNGIFRSRNLFCKSFAIIALVQIISLYPSGWPQFNFLYFIVWLGVWVCNSKQIRMQTDNQINQLFFECPSR